MTPSQQCKALGCPSVAVVARAYDMHPNTLARWYDVRRKVFKGICRDYVANYAKRTYQAAVREGKS